MRWVSRLSLLLAIALPASAPASAALLQVTVSGFTDNTFVGSGDPCGTGLTGGNACNNQQIVAVFVIDTGTAPADSDATTGHGLYRIAAASPVFLTASATINGHSFAQVPNASFNADQSVELWDELNTSGITDRILLAVSGATLAESFTLSANLLMGQVISGDALSALAGPFSGSPVLGGSSSFNFSGASGDVLGQYVVSSVSFATVPEPALAGLLAAAGAALLQRRRRR